jgi:uncharacterized protein (DUF952 family)
MRVWPLYPSLPGVPDVDPCGWAKQLGHGEGIGVMTDGDRERGPAVTLHLVPEDVWLAQKDESRYLPEGFTSEGFIHCTDGDDFAIEVGNRYYRDDPRPYLVLEIDLERVAAPVVYEDDARRYPHIYGPLERHAVRRVSRIERAADGTFIAIGEPAPEHL